MKLVILTKGKKLADGTIRTHGGKKMQKKAGKWLPYSEGGKKQLAKTDNVQEIAASLKKRFRTVVMNPTSNASFVKIKALVSEYGKNKAKKIMVALVEDYAGSPAKATPYIDVIKRIVDLAVRS